MRFEIGSEPWNVYRLEDGTEVKVRTILVAAERREGQFTDDGAPMYDFQFQQIVHVAASKELRRLQHQAPFQPQ